MQIFEKDRIGKFYIDLHLIENKPERLEDVFRRCIVVRAEMLYHKRAIEYTALCYDFAPVPPNVTLPEYQVIFTNEGATFEEQKINL